MAMESLVLAANPGSASRKYAVYNKSGSLLAKLHFEFTNGKIICTFDSNNNKKVSYPDISTLDEVTELIIPTLEENGLLKNRTIKSIGLRTVAPTGYFLSDKLLNDESLEELNKLSTTVPLHIKATLKEAISLKKHLSKIPIVLVSDSAFHITKPDYAWNYAIPLEDSDRLEIKRYGYHGLSVSSIVRKLIEQNKLEDKTIVCHLGSGNSVTAVLNGKSVDNSMGYSPLEGLVMSTRSGSIDVVAALTLKNALKLDDIGLEEYLNTKCGLKGVSGSSDDIRELLEKESQNDYRASLALKMCINHIQQSIGQMSAILNGVDSLVFTGTVGVRSNIIRARILEKLDYLGLVADQNINMSTFEPADVIRISLRTRNKPVYVITTDESQEIAYHVNEFIGSR